ncbi:MAG: hypothetical protein JRI23_04075 [Deltaproteobacteria bacterium]|nr:hypothetical protein [Deltaproteobacteria bacterium]
MTRLAAPFPMLFVTRTIQGLALASMLLGCSAGASGNGSDGGGGAGAGTGAGGTTTTPTGAGGGLGGGLNVGGGEPIVAEVFGHSADTLYKLDPLTKAVTVVGSFVGCSGVLDLAVDKDHNIYGTTSAGVYRIDKLSAQCTLLYSDDYPNSLSFVPEGTVDASQEALVGYLDSDYVRIDTSSGSITTIGSISGGYVSSGDIVSVIGGSTYLTVKGMECDTTDCLFEIDPTTGDMIKNWGHVPYDDVFGLAYWGGQAYGFTNGGDLFEITFGQNDVTTAAITIPGAPSDLSFWGAGSSTSAPLEIPD